MTTATRARARATAIVAACVIAIVSLVLSWRAISTQSAVAQREAARAVAGVERAQEQLDAQQRAAEESTCRILALGRRKPSEPAPTTALGQSRAEQYEAEYRRRGCPL